MLILTLGFFISAREHALFAMVWPEAIFDDNLTGILGWCGLFKNCYQPTLMVDSLYQLIYGIAIFNFYGFQEPTWLRGFNTGLR